MKTQHYEPYSRLSPSSLNGLAGKSVLITGGGYGIGSSIAESFAEAEAKEIVLVGRTLSRLEETQTTLAKRFPHTTVRTYKADISSKEDVLSLFNKLTTSPDILVNNAGFMAKPANFVDADFDEYWSAFEINVYGTALVTQTYLRHRRSFGGEMVPAVVITINTLGAYTVSVPNLSSYGATKAALARWSELVAADVPETTARFVSIHPGAIPTDMGIKSGLDGAFPRTNPKLAGDFIAWSATEEAGFLAGRFAWVNWDRDELLAAREEIVSKNLLKTSLIEP